MDVKHIQIVETNESDDILMVEKLAFGSNEEAELVSNLLRDSSAKPVLSLLAVYNAEAVGHILFTKAMLKEAKPPPSIYILAPLAVIPKYQKQGIGGMLIREGIKRLRTMGVEMVFVLGHKEYYPKHGFIPDAGGLGFAPPYPIPAKDADAWMVQALNSKGEMCGKVICANALDKPEYWRE